MLNVYELTIFVLLCSKKKRRVDQRTLVLASLSKNKYIERKNKQKKNEKKRKEEDYTYSPGNAMSLPRKEEKTTYN